jgi:hypothetical protein
MTNSQDTGSSNAGLLKGTLLALVTAIVVAVLFVLPAEYGVDPTGVGEKLGLLDLGGTDQATSDSSTAANRVVTGTFPVAPADFDFYEPEVLGDPFSRTHANSFQSATLVINLDVGEQVEYKAVMQQGDALVYNWKLENGVIYTDFHADPGEGAEGYPDRYFIRYAESEVGESAGSLVAPFAGNHGWYWLNIEDYPITITLEVRGFYASIDELGRSYQ